MATEVWPRWLATAGPEQQVCHHLLPPRVRGNRSGRRGRVQVRPAARRRGGGLLERSRNCPRVVWVRKRLSTTWRPPAPQDDGLRWLTLAADPELLHEGRNVLAAEVHQWRGYSTDIRFDARLTGTLVPDRGLAGVLANDGDPDDRPITATLVSGPSRGTLRFREDGTFAYTPDMTFVGIDQFQYQAGDGTGPSSVATVSIQVQQANLPPMAVADAYDIPPGQRLVVASGSGVLANDHDLDSDPLSPTGGRPPARDIDAPRRRLVRLCPRTAVPAGGQLLVRGRRRTAFLGSDRGNDPTRGTVAGGGPARPAPNTPDQTITILVTGGQPACREPICTFRSATADRSCHGWGCRQVPTALR